MINKLLQAPLWMGYLLFFMMGVAYCSIFH
jgi:hypothetical protein